MRILPHSFAFTLLLGALAGLPALSIDMGLPSLPLVAAEFGASSTEVAATLSLFMLGFGAAQLVIGPLSDRIGRRPVLLGALALYTLAGAASMMAPSVPALLVARCAQGAGAAGGTVLAFAIIRDLFEGDAARARLSTVSMVFSLAPVVAPSLGALMLSLDGWRSVFALLCFTGLVLFIAVAIGLEESRRLAPPRRHTAILRERRTVAYGVVGALNLGNVFAFVIGSPLVLLGTYGLDTISFALVFALVTAGVIAGAGINRVAAMRGMHPAWPLGLGLAGAALAGVAAATLEWFGGLPLWLLVPLLVLITLSRGLVSPNVTHAALERVPHMAGAASALIGSMQMLTGAFAGLIVGVMFGRFGAGGLFLTMAAFGVPALIAWIYVERRYR
jgi:DHA1 family bicyclomycin/chloramphenicol resistance-like MFS transporter